MKGGKACFWEFVDISKVSLPHSAQKWHGVANFTIAFFHFTFCPGFHSHSVQLSAFTFLDLVRYWLCYDGCTWNNETISAPEPLGTINLHKFLLPIFCYFDVNGNETASASIALECTQLMQLKLLSLGVVDVCAQSHTLPAENSLHCKIIGLPLRRLAV